MVNCEGIPLLHHCLMISGALHRGYTKERILLGLQSQFGTESRGQYPVEIG